jgi:hypothetical protein
MIGRSQGKHYLLLTGQQRFVKNSKTASDAEIAETQRSQRKASS